MNRKKTLMPAQPDKLALSFAEVVTLIQQARQCAFQSVNTELIELYWRVGEYISRKLATAAWDEGVVEQLARYIARQHPDWKGFMRASLFRMRQFYETYQGDEKVAPLVRQLSWSHNLMIMARSKHPEAREFYVRLCIRERWGKRELERQLKSALFERAVLNPPKVSAALRQLHPEIETIFDVRKPHERPSIGVLLCASKDSEVVEYALSRSLSPALIAEYQLQLPDKKLLQDKLREFYELAQGATGQKPPRKITAGRRKPETKKP